MHDALDVRLVERAEDLAADVADALEREREVLLDGAVQIAPVSSSMAMKRSPSSSPKSMICRMLGCDSIEALLASR